MDMLDKITEDANRWLKRRPKTVFFINRTEKLTSICIDGEHYYGADLESLIDCLPEPVK